MLASGRSAALLLRVEAHEVCTLALQTRFRGPVSFTVVRVPGRGAERVYLLPSREIGGLRSVSYTLPRWASRRELIASAAYLACCLTLGEERADCRVLAELGIDPATGVLGARPEA
jgi:hypothetical protein